MRSYRRFKRQLLNDRATKRAYEKLGPEFEVIALLIERRLKKGLTQSEIARRMGTKQSAISRLESGEYNPTLNFLQKVAAALNARLKISLSTK